MSACKLVGFWRHERASGLCRRNLGAALMFVSAGQGREFGKSFDRRRVCRLLLCLAATATCIAWWLNWAALAARDRLSSEEIPHIVCIETFHTSSTRKRVNGRIHSLARRACINSYRVPYTLLLSPAQQRLHIQSSPAWLAEKEVNPDRAIEAIQRNSWYDKEKKDFAPPKNLYDPDTPLRRSGWTSHPKVKEPAKTNTATGTGTGTGTGRSWLSGFDSQWLNYALIAGLAVLLVLATLALSYSSLRNWLPGRFRRRGDFKAAQIDITKVVDLPFEVKPTRHDPLSEAEALMSAGRFDEAIVFLFGYVLLALDQASMIQLQRGKTNRVYLRELKGRSQLRSITELTMQAFEDVFFGRYRLSRDRFLEVWDQLPAFHELIQPQDSSHSPRKDSTS